MPAADSAGKSLLPLLGGDCDTLREVCVSHWRLGDVEEWALRTREWAFLLPGSLPEPAQRGPQLYAKPDDRWEVNNLLQHHQELAEEMEKRLRDGFRA
jgi:hypothetical protein